MIPASPLISLIESSFAKAVQMIRVKSVKELKRLIQRNQEFLEQQVQHPEQQLLEQQTQDQEVLQDQQITDPVQVLPILTKENLLSLRSMSVIFKKRLKIL